MHPSSALVDRSRHTILVVDDDEASRYATAKHLRHAGFQTREAATGEEAIALVDAAHAVVLDVHLPGMSGLDVCERLRSLDGHLDLPILQCSGIFTRDADKVAGLRSGADAYLTKPVDEQLLIANLDALLRNRERLRRLADQLDDTRRQEDKARDLFLAVLGHDLRGPLDAILMSATLMVRTEESSPTALRIASRILSSGDRMKQMLEDTTTPACAWAAACR
ncbi:hypothetical protein CDN99_24640 [Roseateles aquatilis]|uniref:histidine kinase n=1 Tax=Roseateles aquatilis TaxID=431061 RepID=A0A246IV29_9BURK|nr:response regulator [Roseateles aquatilis]OWQ84078.1 hypothetical protein CDN99_24640 [Roseateles aquatilis]